jgi:hypothetical protein
VFLFGPFGNKQIAVVTGKLNPYPLPIMETGYSAQRSVAALLSSQLNSGEKAFFTYLNVVGT